MNLQVNPIVDEWRVSEPFIGGCVGVSEAYKYESKYGSVTVTLAERPDDKIHVVFKVPTRSTRVYEAVFTSSDLAVLNCKERMQGITNADSVVEYLEDDQLFS